MISLPKTNRNFAPEKYRPKGPLPASFREDWRIPFFGAEPHGRHPKKAGHSACELSFTHFCKTDLVGRFIWTAVECWYILNLIYQCKIHIDAFFFHFCLQVANPKCSMYGLLTYMKGEKWPHSSGNVCKNSLHGASGWLIMKFRKVY